MKKVTTVEHASVKSVLILMLYLTWLMHEMAMQDIVVQLLLINVWNAKKIVEYGKCYCTSKQRFVQGYTKKQKSHEIATEDNVIVDM